MVSIIKYLCKRIKITSNIIVIGLAFDLVGFLMVFAFGGFEFGSSKILKEDDKSKITKPFKIIGAILVILGFLLQMIGTAHQA